MSDDGVTSGPIDVGAVRRDDAFLDDLAAGRAANVADGAEYELAGLLAGWRADSISGPIPSTPTVEDIEAAIVRANERERRGGLSRRLRIVSGAAAVLAVVGAGLLVMSEGSSPGDPLWSVKQVVFSEQAQQTQARMNAEDNIEAAKSALESGDVAKANELIEKAEADIGPLKDKDQADDLRKMIEAMRDENPGKLLPTSSQQKPPTSASSTETPNPTVMKQSPTSTSTGSSSSTSKSPTTSTSEQQSTSSTRPTASGSVGRSPSSSSVR